MRVPFFSREPTVKKQKKKLLCMKCKRHYASDASKSYGGSKIKQHNNKIKKAYANLCPKCIKKLIKKHGFEKPEKIKPVHGSREFYQNVVTVTDYNQNDIKPINANFEDLINGRVKRGENEERERQLKELAEVEKKVDHVQITRTMVNSKVYHSTSLYDRPNDRLLTSTLP